MREDVPVLLSGWVADSTTVEEMWRSIEGGVMRSKSLVSRTKGVLGSK